MSGNARASSSSSSSSSSIRHVPPPPPPPAPGQPNPDLPLPVSSTQKKQDDFRRYLSGQSVMKSGLTRDPKEVEQIIAQASENSKFYLREVEKDRALGSKIERLIKVKDEMIKGANMPRLEKEANELLAQLESTRDLTQYIVHVDMDAFASPRRRPFVLPSCFPTADRHLLGGAQYANVEEKKDPSLKGKAFGVGSGVLTTASYEARKYGCRSGMAGFVAKKLCPGIIFVKPDFVAYGEASRGVREVLLEYDENLAMVGMDEGYLNITPYMAAHEMTASSVVSHLRTQVQARLGLTISAGIAPNKLLAKICSDKNKPDGQFELAFSGKAIREFMRDLPVRRIPGIGRVAERYAAALGIHVCGDAYVHRGVVNLMDRYIGFKYMMRAYLGLGSNNVEPGKREDRKSVGCERTFREKNDSEEILQILSEIVDNLEQDLKRTGYSARTVVVKYKLHSYEIFTRQCGAPRYINKAEEILPLARSLLLKELPLKIRLLGIRMTGLKDLRAEEKGIQKYFKDGSTLKEPSAKARDSDDDEPIWLDSEEEPDPPFDRAASNQAEESSRKRKSPGTSDVITMIEDDSDEDEVEIVCPVCSKLFSSKSNANTVNQHINDCLDKQNPRSDQKVARAPITNKITNETTNPSSKKRKTTKQTKPKDVFELLMKKGKGSR